LVTFALLYELANLFMAEADAITQPYAWPPRPDLTPEERREVDRLIVTSRRIAYRAACAAYEEQDGGLR
jgi:hypothetical protein